MKSQVAKCPVRTCGERPPRERDGGGLRASGPYARGATGTWVRLVPAPGVRFVRAGSDRFRPSGTPRQVFRGPVRTRGGATVGGGVSGHEPEVRSVRLGSDRDVTTSTAVPGGPVRTRGERPVWGLRSFRCYPWRCVWCRCQCSRAVVVRRCPSGCCRGSVRERCGRFPGVAARR